MPTRKVTIATHNVVGLMLLQWGRVVADAEGLPASTSASSTRSRFNGAASLPTRKAAYGDAAGPHSPTLQWGRVVADAEGR